MSNNLRVPLFHQTDNPEPILEGGLKTGFPPPDIFKVFNPAIDSYRPKRLVKKGVSRSSVYAYHSLHRGVGLVGASQQFVEHDDAELREDFRQYLHEYPEYKGLTEEEFIRLWRDPAFLQEKFPGNVLSFSADPETCYVGDMRYVNDIQRLIDDGADETAAIKDCAKKYWRSVITLREFLENYEQPGEANPVSPYKLKQGTLSASGIVGKTAHAVRHVIGRKPTPNLPREFSTPEVLVPYDVPPDGIDVAKH